MATTDPSRSPSPAPGPAATPVADLQAEIVELRRQLWAARDAAIGATAEAGALRARTKELEMLIHQLRVEIAALHQRSRITPRRVAGAVKRRLLG